MIFQSTKYLLTLSTDGYFRIWSTKNWELLNQFHAHSDCALSLGNIPHLCLTLTIGTDKTIKLWDLYQGKIASNGTFSLKKSVRKWLILRIIRQKKSNTNFIIICGDFKTIFVYEIDTVALYLSWDIEYNRTRDLKVIDVPFYGQVIVTVHSEGDVIIWDARDLKLEAKPQILCQFHVNDRLLCCTAFSPTIPID
ncbi:hypothetical protein HZS_3134 [Henneguya salminicola]|nr:hypothetical protein HZS_3134 [Henneguya salminicola]